MNKVELMGRLTKDVELKKMKTKDGKKSSYARFSLAIPRKNDREQTDFINCVAFGKIAEIIKEYTSKGLRIIVCGELQINNYEDDEGNKRQSCSIIVNDFYFVDFKSDDEDSNKKKATKKSKKMKNEEDDEDEEDDQDDLPF